MTTVELLNRLTQNKELTYFRDTAIKNYFTVSEKQFKWIWGVLSCEFVNADPAIGASVTDDEGNVWGLSWKSYAWNVPHFIKNREKYGKTFYISFNKKP